MPRAAGEGGGGGGGRNGIRAALTRRVHAAAWAPGEGGGGGPAPAPAPPPQPAVDPYNFDADPIYQRVIAANQRRVAEAQANSLAARRQLAIESGDESLADDEATRQAARNNPFSMRAQFERRSREAPRAQTEADNAENLFYSSTAARRQSDLATQLLGEQQGMQRDVRGRLSDIEAALRGVQSGAEDDLIAAQEAAAGRRRDILGDLDVSGGGGDQGGGAPPPAAGGGAARAHAQATERIRRGLTHRAAARIHQPRPLPHPPRRPGRRP